MNTHPVDPSTGSPSTHVAWDDLANAHLVAVAPVLACVVRFAVAERLLDGATEGDPHVDVDLVIERGSLVLRFVASSCDGGYVYVEAGTYGDLYVGPEPRSSIAERYNVAHPSWNPGGVDWLAVLPARIAAVLIGEEWFS